MSNLLGAALGLLLLLQGFGGKGGVGGKGGTGGGVTPGCFTSSTQAKYDADSLVASPVTVNWPDTSGNSRDMVPANNPTWAANQFNGHAAVTTNGSNQDFACYSTCGSGTGIPVSTNNTVYWVGSLASVGVTSTVEGNHFTSGASLQSRIDGPPGTPEMVKQGVAVIGTATSNISALTGYVLAFNYNNSTGAYAFYINGTASGSGTNAQSITVGMDTLFSNAGTGEWMNGKTALVTFTNAAYDSAYNSCLRTRYGI